VERTRYRETTRTFRQKGSQPAAEAKTADTPAPAPAAAPKKAKDSTVATAEKPGKKEKIRFGQAPTKTLPKSKDAAPIEDAGAVQVAGSGQEPANPLEAAPPQKKSRFSERAKVEKQAKQKAAQGLNAEGPAAPDAAEVADRQTQSAPLGPTDAAPKKKRGSATVTEKTRLSDKKKEPDQTPEATPIAPVPGAPAPAASQPQAATQTPTPQTQPAAPQQ
jgi:peptidyl-prolyl cis-trans isomerase SurA